MADIQRRMKEEFAIGLTYMETRFLVLDLNLQLQEERPVVEPKKEEDTEEPTQESPAAGGVQVSMDQIAMPGTLVSGKVTFSDGETGRWYMDQMGRLGLDPDTMGYRPPQQDITSFQEQLRNLMRSYGA